ncbi:hypothetical protein [Micromonospora sp. NPDC005171]|uniref:hypothetical protein n=1 Tax=Micromonospora sp. NPDC005171 TaxID=3156866 RepID=UPI0033A9C134
MAGSLITLRILMAVIAVLASLLCGVMAGILKRLDGASVPTTLMRAGATFGACLTIGVMVMDLLWGT